MKKRCKPASKDGFSKKENIEQGAILKHTKGLIKAALVYPNTYSAGMSSLGFQTVYRLLNQMDRVTCERVFLPDQEKRPQEAVSIESALSLSQFDIIFFSISFENDFIHLVQLLKEAGIPLRSPDRNHLHPLVVAGGVACFLNPEPIAPFMDIFLLGEAECLIEPFFSIFEKSADRASLLHALEQTIPGAYVPNLHTEKKPFRIQVQYLKSLAKISTFTSILTSRTAFKDAFLIETLKGCPHGCRFCSAGFIYRPPRIYPAGNIMACMDSASGKTDRIGLVSSAIADHPDIEEICTHGKRQGFKLSFSSLRADKLSEGLIQVLSSSGVKTATIAPEAGSERMRAVINKKIKEGDILFAAKKLVEAGIINIKLYFMIGLPFEEDADAHAIVDLTKKIKLEFLNASKKKHKIGTLTLSINQFIPKPFTPFQWSPMEKESVLKKRADIIKEGLKKIPNVKINVESLRKAKIHALLSLGDQKAADILEDALIKGWPAAIKGKKEYYDAVVYREKALEAPLPWDFLDNRVRKEFLAKEFIKAGKEKISASCPMIDCTVCRTCI
ncbi:MAG: radical SAM protein [Desulfobacterales bacterium RIFOXYA12_FULL_46_15]|nr:MAG: radical SAM protein [Desulfobacterales bacterium RIFOXYA12_FULL_46_15]